MGIRMGCSCTLAALALMAAPQAHAKNYLVIIADDVAVDKVGSYAADYPGYAPSYLPDTQTIDSLAAAGVRFTRAWATPLCSPTRAAFQTGLQPYRTGIGTALGDGAPGVDTSSPLMIAKSFAARGYTTGLFGKYHIGTKDKSGVTGVPRDVHHDLAATFTTEPHPSLAGWDRFFGGYDGEPDTSASEDSGYFQWIRVGWLKASTGHVAVETTHATERVESEALSWINTRTQPWLAVVAFNAAHSSSGAAGNWDYDAVIPPAGSSASAAEYRTPALACLASGNCTDRKRQVYQALVEDMDTKIQTLLDGIHDDILDDTLIVVFGDNGTPGQHYGAANSVQESIFDVPDRGKGTIYENGTRVPLIIADGQRWRTGAVGPTITAPGRTVVARVNTLDLYNTLFTDAFHASIANTPTQPFDSMPFNDCFTVNDIYCGYSLRFGYTEMFSSTVSPPTNPGPTGAAVAVSYGYDTMIATYDAGKSCLQAKFYDTSTDPLETVAQIWKADRVQRLTDHFTGIHTPVTSWAHPSGQPVVSFCSIAVLPP